MAYSYGLSIINTHLEFGAKIYLNEVSPVNVKFWQIVKNQKLLISAQFLKSVIF